MKYTINLTKKILIKLITYFVRLIKYQYFYLQNTGRFKNSFFNWDWNKVNFNRIALVNLLLNKFKNASYLEIGCDTNSLFNSIPLKNKIGVDPSSGGTIRKTSDDFFKSNKVKFDVIFIDGLHTYEQVRRDIINSIKFLNKGGFICIHDMLPRNWAESHPANITTGAWLGDVWKVAFELIDNDYLEFKILKIDYGIGIIKVTNPKAKIKDLHNHLKDKDFSYYSSNLKRIPIIEWNDLQDWLKA
ncbi:class I SAM-dependent methyltransferase [Candidatus Methylopumilus planktonicus]|uniref:class I SAM-dependent methyltransferase n=1 Tax=Candidatus Methylopumilus planktonicus TaxID=1581557 RepID=UPI00111F2A48|nr:class I SAM-dependent methyltransferase [Candidatus Methylopumilus planktonicus]QDD07083.1 class I SAM-dependent methyltransferase [Candidatus Methylopumilus planktonicus]QDD08419.1 class I SAM-dependent methyltransferase [Candidatus Methylopumilus planktonicus]QDD09743.1 class I SAM-dependent methyltransferase [Candidatus Methylopumilus planktonicus]